MLKNVKVLCHNCIRIQGEEIVYTDPFHLEKEYHDADIILITHSHYDHFSPEDIEKVKSDKTVIVVTEDLIDKALEIGFSKEKIVSVLPGQEYEMGSVKFSTIPAYNTNKNFHPKENNWVGYLVNIEGKKYYIAGDTDITKEAKQVKCDVAFVPVGGTYTMTAEEAAKLVRLIQPKIAVPVHFGVVVGSLEDARRFQELLEDIECRIML